MSVQGRGRVGGLRYGPRRLEKGIASRAEKTYLAVGRDMTLLRRDGMVRLKEDVNSDMAAGTVPLAWHTASKKFKLCTILSSHSPSN